MNWNKITIPAAGTWKAFEIGGRSITVESIPQYSKPEEVPQLAFNDKSNTVNRLYPQSDYNAPGKFSKIWIRGTAESAGDQVYIITYNCHQQSNINPNLAATAVAVPGVTKVKQLLNDSVQQFTDAELQNVDGDLPKIMYIYVLGGATRGINYSYNTDPPQGDGAECFYWDNDRSSTPSDFVKIEPLEIKGLSWILDLRFRPAVVGETPSLIWQGGY